MKNYDFFLALISILLLALIGIVSLYGTSYSWLASLDNPDWTRSFLYSYYLERMNSAAAPLVIALIIALGLCIPKRIFSRIKMLLVSGLILALGLLFYLFFEPLHGLAFILLAGITIQLTVVILIFFRARILHFEREGLLASLGSSLLHLGFVAFLFDFILLQESPYHLSIFWISTGFITFGSALSFYSTEISRILPRKK